MRFDANKHSPSSSSAAFYHPGSLARVFMLGSRPANVVQRATIAPLGSVYTSPMRWISLLTWPVRFTFSAPQEIQKEPLGALEEAKTDPTTSYGFAPASHLEPTHEITTKAEHRRFILLRLDLHHRLHTTRRKAWRRHGKRHPSNVMASPMGHDRSIDWYAFNSFPRSHILQYADNTL
jgi:hypothetical protein